MTPGSPDRDAYDELGSYTLTRGDRTFIHQHVVDAFAAQNASPSTKPIALAFALLGLYLHVERGFTGRQVQRAHMMLAKRSRSWPTFALPTHRGAMTAHDVMAAPAGVERDAAIDAWCAAVWAAYREVAPSVAALATAHGLDAWTAE
jgi:ribosomal protein L4